jgi:hypothetical protein
MPLPFLKSKKDAGVQTPMIKHREPDEGKDNEALKACGQDILRAIKSDDAEHLALALKALIEICDYDEPESDSEEDNSFHSMNIKAARDSSE